jgi:fatty acid-binding protein DegV
MLAAIGQLKARQAHQAQEYVAELREQAASLLPAGDTLVANITPVIGAHIGPGAIGFAVVSAQA